MKSLEEIARKLDDRDVNLRDGLAEATVALATVVLGRTAYMSIVVYSATKAGSGRSSHRWGDGEFFVFSPKIAFLA